jgi:Raf kinase inhibitor-like YbhB/YbcL family protein
VNALLVRFVLVMSLVAFCVGCGPESTPTTSLTATTPQPATQVEATAVPAIESEPTRVPEEGESVMGFILSSIVFAEGDPIPQKYSCDGEDVSPPMQWTDPPEGTTSFALIVDDPDAPVGTWVHWVLYNLPAETRSLLEAFPSDPDLPDGTKNGENSWGRLGYGGPCPPGGTHRYFFKLYALDLELDMAAGATIEQLRQAMEGHVLAESELMGTYSR